jgi:uncharacterized protein
MSNYYPHAVRTATKSVSALKTILQKIPEFIEASKNGRGQYLIEESYILSSRIAPDMYPLLKQVQIVSDNLKGLVSRLSGVENPKMDDEQSTLYEIVERLQKTLEYVKSVDPVLFDTADTRTAKLPWMAEGTHLEMEDYVIEFALPNIYFHVVTCYNILRSLGMDIGKGDFIGGMNIKGS